MVKNEQTSEEDTIFALSTAPGRAGIAVVRVSGPKAYESALRLTGQPVSPPSSASSVFQPNVAKLCKLIDNSGGNPADSVSHETIDRGVILTFKAPNSYTGEDIAEYHIHGGRAVIESLLNTLKKQPGHRMALPGEFTQRAFMNGKLDLTEAEAVADLINAETQAQKDQALAQLGGQLALLYAGWSDNLKNALAYIEADIEFPDEDLPDGIEKEIRPKMRGLLAEIEAHLDDNRRGERLRDGVQVVVIGAPNAGKSSLVNLLAQRDVAIVSDVAGTTRDVIEVPLDLGGYPVIVVDTAGLRPEHIAAEGHDKIENEGMRRALDRAQQADIKVLVFDGASVEADAATLNLMDENAILVLNKADQKTNLDLPAALKISAQTGAGIPEFLAALQTRIESMIGRSEAPSLTRQRHRHALEESVEALKRAEEAALPEMMAEDLRLAMRAIGRITGKVDVEDLLDVVFRDFCIGK